MTILGTIALIVLVVLGVMVLRVKSDPLEKESVRKVLAEAKRGKSALPAGSPQGTETTHPGEAD
jgi:hypothetical protein